MSEYLSREAACTAPASNAEVEVDPRSAHGSIRRCCIGNAARKLHSTLRTVMSGRVWHRYIASKEKEERWRTRCYVNRAHLRYFLTSTLESPIQGTCGVLCPGPEYKDRPVTVENYVIN